MDAHSFDHLLRGFGFTTGDGAADVHGFCQWLERKGGFVHGRALLDAMFDQQAQAQGLTGESRQTLRQLLDFAAAPDIGLGCVARPWRAAYLEALQAWHDYSKEPAAVVQYDFRNMANANDALGRKQVDRLMKLITTQTQALLAAGGSHQQAGVTVVRPGGDEVEFLVTGVESHELSRRLAEVNKACGALLQTLGTVTTNPHDAALPASMRSVPQVDALSLLAYKKHPDDRYKTGFGVGMGAVMLRNGQQGLTALQDQLDAEIAQHKEREGEQRFKGFSQQFGGETRWHPLTPQQVRSMLPLAQVGQVIAQAEARAGITQQHPQRMNWPEALVLAAALDRPSQDLYTAQKAALTEFKRQLPTQGQRHFTDALGKLVNMRDPQTGFKSARMLAGSLEYLRTHSPSRLVLAELELSNLVTLNNLLGTEGANQCKQAVAEQVLLPCLQEALGTGFMPARDVYHAGGSRMRLLLRDVDMPTVAQALQQVAQRVEEEINRKPLGEALDGLGLPALKAKADAAMLAQPCAVLQHPKKDQRSVVQGGFVPRGGFELMYSAMQVETALRAALTINLVEALKESYEAHPVLLREQLREKGQLFLHTGHTAWVVGNAQDATGVVQGIPEVFQQVIVDRGQRLGRGRYPALLLEGASVPTPDTRTQPEVRSVTPLQNKGRSPD